MRALLALCLGMAWAGAGCAVHRLEMVDEEGIVESGRHVPDSGIDGKLIQWAKRDHVSLLRYALAHYDAHYRAYECTLIRQEIKPGQALAGPVERIEVTCRDKPFAVLMKWVENPGAALKVLYAEGEYKNQLQVRPVLLPFLTVASDPNSEEVRKASRQPITKFGFRRSLERMIDVYTRAAEAGAIKSAEYLGPGRVDGRLTLVLSREIEEFDSKEAGRLIYHIDAEYLVPTAVYDFDASGRLLGKYIFVDVNFGVQLPGDAFEKKTVGL